MCSWGVIETVSYFLRNGSEVFGCSMDKSKAFDMCKFSILFSKLFNKISHVFLKIIIVMYVNQFSNVRWNSEVSSSFTISNGVGQGKILAGFVYWGLDRDRERDGLQVGGEEGRSGRR